ncbi:MAG: putative quinol monooxygenase [Gammaproteobacteria bacterium]|nr:putative quinol monooxygenase [Gammaproteobacteria bacterium]
MAISLIAKLTIQDGKNEEFENIFKELEEAVRANEPGNVFYSCNRTDNANEYIVLEQYVDQEALDAHRDTDHFKKIGGKLGGVMAGRPDLQRLETIS